MADSPFVDPAMIEGAALPEEAPGLTRQRRDALLGVAGGALTFLPLGKLLSLGTPVKRALTGAGVGGGIVAAGDVMAQGKSGDVFPSPMHELQARLKKQGIYQGPVDGTSNPGGPTEKAVERLHKMFGEGEPLHVLRMIQDPEYRKSEEAKSADKSKTEAELKKTELGLAETKRKADLDKRIAEAAKEGESWGGFAKRWAPYLIGAGLGATAGAVPTYLARKGATKAAGDIDAFAAKHFAGKAGKEAVKPGNVADKAGAVNTFWEKGGGNSPFTKMTTSGELSPKSRSFQVSDQTPVGSLYKPTTKDRAKVIGTDALMLGGAGADYFGTSMLAEKNQKQADEARKRFEATQGTQDAVEATHAQGRSNAWAGASNAALPFAISYLATRKLYPRKAAAPKMESLQGADATRLKVQDYLNRQPSGGPQSVLAHKPGGAPAPIAGGPLKALPAPTSPGGIGPHTSEMGRAAAAERRANTEKIMTGSMAQKTQQVMQEHVNSFAKAIKEGPNAGAPLLSTRKINELQRKLEAEHGILISNHRLRQILKKAGVVLG